MKPLSICHVLASHKEIGGLEKNVIDLSRKQTEQGHDVTVLTTITYLNKFAPGVKTIDAKLERSRTDFRLKWGLSKILNHLSPDIVHAHANKAAHLIGKLPLNSKKIATMQNLKSNQSVFTPFDQVICASQIVADSLSIPHKQVIWNAVASSDPANKDEALELKPPFLHEGKPIFLAAARFVPAKGFDLLLKAFAQTQGCYLWLIGDGKDKPQLNQLIEKHQIHNRLWMPGFITPNQVNGLMQVADCFLITSRKEGGPYTLAEALRAQCPVLSTHVGYAPEFLRTDQLISEITVTNITKALNNYLKDPAYYKSNIQDIFKHAEKNLDLDAMVKKVEKVYIESQIKN